MRENLVASLKKDVLDEHRLNSQQLASIEISPTHQQQY
jgi:hypothetical protein